MSDSIRERIFNAIIDRLLEKYVEKSVRGVDWSDAGITAQRQTELNREGFLLSRIAFPTISIDPTANPMDMLKPASAADADPYALIYGANAGAQIKYTLANKTNPVFKQLEAGFAAGTAAVRFMTFESPSGTDYQVPAGKQFHFLQVQLVSAAVAANDQLRLQYGDDGVAEGTVDQANPVIIAGGTADALNKAWLRGTTANVQLSSISTAWCLRQNMLP